MSIYGSIVNNYLFNRELFIQSSVIKAKHCFNTGTIQSTLEITSVGSKTSMVQRTGKWYVLMGSGMVKD